jgi:hypothetical protein
LKAHAKEEFHKQPLGQFVDWISLRDAFITKFLLVGYIDRLTKQMHELQMSP